MDSIINILTDPGAWVGGILFGLIATAIYKWFELLPRQMREFSRSSRLKSLRRIREDRENPLEVVSAIGNANVYFVTFLMLSLFYVGMIFISTTYRTILNESRVLGFVITAPVFIFEVVWLNQNFLAKRLVRAHGKLLKYRARRASKA